MDGSNSKRNQTLILEILKNTLEKSTVSHKRNCETPQEFKDYFEQHQTLILDATEQHLYYINDV